jgi:hypothetical protein
LLLVLRPGALLPALLEESAGSGSGVGEVPLPALGRAFVLVLPLGVLGLPLLGPRGESRVGSVRIRPAE